MNETLGRRLWMALLTGIPFAVYKLGFGWYEFQHGNPAIGVAAIIWGCVDMGLNVLAVPLPKIVGVCFLSTVGRWFDREPRKVYWEGILLAIDTTATFLIVLAMILFGRLPLSPPWMADAWNVALVGNILSVCLEQLYRAVRKRYDL